MIRTLYFFLTDLLLPKRSLWKSTPPASREGTLWFHAASAGELEVLIPLIEEAQRLNVPIVLSIFSPSAEKSLSKLSFKTLYSGFAPAESEWEFAFEHFKVREFITARYEAWPGLWSAASAKSVRISIVCASVRSSLVWAKRWLRGFGVQLPKLRFFALDLTSSDQLSAEFPHADIIHSVDPRWIRVMNRAEYAKEHPSVVRWKSQFENKPRPYWVIGSAWNEDLEFLSPFLKEYSGTIWVVPHVPHDFSKTAQSKWDPSWVWVDEMGFLLELYSIADRVWVGGGFSQGVHSTMEPSVFGIPVACGPKNAEKFLETRELTQKGILKICTTRESVQSWIQEPISSFVLALEEKRNGFQTMIRIIFS